MAVRQSAGTLSEEEAFFEAFFDKLGDREIGEFIPDVPPTAKRGLLKVRCRTYAGRVYHRRTLLSDLSLLNAREYTPKTDLPASEALHARTSTSSIINLDPKHRHPKQVWQKFLDSESGMELSESNQGQRRRERDFE